MPRDVSKRANRATQPQPQGSRRMTFEELLATAGDVSQYREYNTYQEGERDFGIYETPTGNLMIDFTGEYGKWEQSLTPDEMAGIEEYTGGSFQEMNEALRKGFTPPEEIQKYIDDTQSALLKSQITEGITVVRNTGYNMFGGLQTAADIEEAFKGKVTLEKAFLSGSISKSKEYAGNRPVQVTIHYAPGTYGQYVDPMATWTGEKEFLGAAGQHWVLNFAKEANGKVYADITVLSADAVNQYTQGTGGRDAQARGAYYNQKRSV